jgi:hypothetical protein
MHRVWDGLRIAFGLYTIVVMVIATVVFGGVPWPFPLIVLAMGITFWRRRAHLKRIAESPDLVAADRRSQSLAGFGLIAFLGGFLAMGVSPAASEPELVFVIGMAAIVAGGGLLAYRAFTT